MSRPTGRPPETRGEKGRYLADAQLVAAVNTALIVEQPLLVTGEPGTGKTTLAWSVATELGLGDVLNFHTRSDHQARDALYEIDHLLRFYHAQIQRRARDAARVVHPVARARRSDPSPTRRLVLIDEIDKAPRDFPNDLLDEIDQMEFRVPELAMTLQGGAPAGRDHHEQQRAAAARSVSPPLRVPPHRVPGGGPAAGDSRSSGSAISSLAERLGVGRGDAVRRGQGAARAREEAGDGRADRLGARCCAPPASTSALSKRSRSSELPSPGALVKTEQDSACSARPAERRTMSVAAVQRFPRAAARERARRQPARAHRGRQAPRAVGRHQSRSDSAMRLRRWSRATKTRRASSATCSISSIHARLLRPSGRPRRALWHAGGIAAFSSSGAALHGPSPWPSSPARSRQDLCCGYYATPNLPPWPPSPVLYAEVVLPAPPPPDVPTQGPAPRDRVRRADAVLPCG